MGMNLLCNIFNSVSRNAIAYAFPMLNRALRRQFSWRLFNHAFSASRVFRLGLVEVVGIMGTVLLVIDMQRVFVNMTTVALPNILKLCDHFKASNLPLIFTQHGHSKEELTPPLENQLVRKWGPAGSIAIGTRDWDFLPEIRKTAKDHRVVAKNTYDAFLNTDLSNILERESIERVVVYGVMTDCCCDTTARSAFNRGYETWLVQDACGSANKRQHEAGLRGFGFAFGEVLSTAEVIKRLK